MDVSGGVMSLGSGGSGSQEITSSGTVFVLILS